MKFVGSNDGENPKASCLQGEKIRGTLWSLWYDLSAGNADIDGSFWQSHLLTGYT